MTCVDQTDTTPATGNCFQACVASVLELPLESVPHFCRDYGDQWFTAFEQWLHEFGLSAFSVLFPNEPSGDGDEPLPVSAPYGYAIASGRSPRGEHLHAIVLQGDGKKWVDWHDPHPSGDGIETYVDMIVLTPMWPARCTRAEERDEHE